ncbi:MAG TPA: class I SAM-dependent methyltransferase [Gemmataceae bacterium]|jgi:SAM-dependent methyltransferase
MPATDRLLRERLFHDRQARARAATFAARPDRLRFRDADYLDHETWVRPALARLGDVAGRPVLDLGCGHGMAAVVLARRGAVVTACDLSAGYVAEARARARANEADVRCVQADAHRLPFAAGSFAAVWGHAILHHLDVPAAAGELRRVLAPGGVAVLCEPWGGNPLVRLARRWLPYPGKGHTADEAPLGPRQVRELGAVFGHVEVHGFQVLGALRRVTARPRMRAALDRADERLLGRWPSLRRFGRYVVLTVRRGE